MARRVNTRFIGIFAACAIGAVGVVYVAQKTLVHGSAAQFRQAAVDAGNNKDWRGAVANWSRAVAASPNDPDLWRQYGVALHELGLQDPEFAAKQQDRDAWEHALEINPGYPADVPQEYLPAVADLVEFWREQLANPAGMNTDRLLEAYRGATDRATQFLDILSKASDDTAHPEFKELRKEIPDTQVFLYTTIAQEWIKELITDDPAGLAAAAAQPSLDTPRIPLADTEQKMRDLLAQQIAAKGEVNADLPFYLALMDIHRGQLEAQANQGATTQPSSVTDWYQKAEAEMTDVLKSQGKSPTMHYSAAEVESSLADVDHSADDSRDKHRLKANDEMDTALALMTGKEPLYAKISLQAAQTDYFNHDYARAHSILSALFKNQGANPGVVVDASSLAASMPDLRDQAIKTLKSDIGSSANSASVGGQRFFELEALSELETGALSTETDDKAKAALSADITSNLQQMANAGQDAQHVKLLTLTKARYLLIDHNFVAAVQAITTAMASDTRLSKDPQLIWLLANAYDAATERAQAEVYLRTYISDDPTSLRAREMLVTDLFNDASEQATNEISQQFDYLCRVAATDPEVIRLLANACRVADDRSQAEAHFRQIIQANPKFILARKLFVEGLLADGSTEAKSEANDQLNYLRGATPNDTDVIRLQMLVMDPSADADKLKALFSQLPQDTPQELRNKADVAVSTMQNPDEAASLLTQAMAKGPDSGDVRTAVGIALKFDANKQRAKALDLVQKVLAVHPNEPNLVLLVKKYQGASEADLTTLHNQLEDQVVEKDSEVVAHDRALALEDLQPQSYSPDLAEHYLKDAEAADPNNVNVWNDLFSLYIQTKQFDKIPPYLRKLQDANFDEAHGLLLEFEVAQAKKDVKSELDIGRQLISALPEFGMSYFDMGQAYQDSGQFQQAIENYDTAIQKKGVGEYAALMLKDEIDCYQQLNQPDKAMVAIEEGRREFPNDAGFLFLRSDYEVKHGEAHAAANDLVEILKDNPQFPDIYLKLAAAEVQDANDKIRMADRDGATAAASNAVAVMKEAVKRFPDDPEMYRTLADIYRNGSDPTDAEKTIRSLDARTGWSEKPDVPQMLAQLYAQTNQPEKAEAAYAEAIRRAKGTPRLANLITSYANLLVNYKKYDEAINFLTPYAAKSLPIRQQRINILITAGRTADAEAEIKALLEENASNAAQVANLQSVWAKLELDSHNLSTAAEHDAKALAADPNSLTALEVRSNIHLSQSPPDVDGAINDLNAALQINPDNAQIMADLANCYLDKLDADRAATILQTALRGHPEDVSIRLRLAEVYSAYPPKRLDQALQILQDGLNQPDGRTNADLALAIVQTYQMMGKNDQALQNCEVSLNAIPGNQALIQTLLDLLVDVGQYKDAIPIADTMLKQDDKLWWAWGLRGQAKAGVGDKAGAGSDLNQALTIADSQNNSGAAYAIVDTIAKVISLDAAISIVRQRQGSDPRWTVKLVMLYHENGQDDLAIAAVEPLLGAANQLPPAQRVPVLELAGMIYATAQPTPQADKAYAVYNQILAINKDNVTALNNLASLCADDFTPPRVEEGLRDVRHAIDLANARGATDPSLEDTYGWLLILGGNTEEGMGILQKAAAAAAQKPFPDVYYHLGEGYLRLNRPQDALQQVNLALKAMSDARGANQAFDPLMRVRVQDLSARVLSALGQ
ncbi:MAG: tetratricopeptide repeat protein [Tepidisphaeraceae bacterium]